MIRWKPLIPALFSGLLWLAAPMASAQDDGSDAVPTEVAPRDALGSALSRPAAAARQAAENATTRAQQAMPNLPDAPDFGESGGESGGMTLEFPTAETQEAMVTRDAETISVDFPDEDVRTIIRNVADLYDLNVVIPDTLTGNTSIKLRNVTWRQVFEVVLEPLNFTYVEDRNIIKLKSNEELLQEPTDTRVFIINFAQAGDIQGSIAPLVDSSIGGRIQVDSRSNSLVITERPSRMNNIQEIIERLDRPTSQVMIESKFIEITDRDAKNIGVNWASLNSYSLTGGPFNRNWDSSNQKTSSSGIDNSNTVDNSSNATSTSSTNLLDPGSSSADESTDENFSIQDTINTLSNVAFSSSEGRVNSAVFSADAFSVVLSLLKTESEVELISNPTVVTMNNTQAQINIGEEFPVPDYQYNDEQGTFEVSGFTYKPIGIILNVTPQVNSAGFINLAISPEISSRAGTVNFGGAAGAEIPIVATRKTSSTVTIKDGFTLAIGGLVEQTVDNTTTRVPVLGSIPVVGRAFRSRALSDQRRNLIIFITAKTLNPDGSTYKEVFSPQTLYEMGITDRDVPGYEYSEEELKLYESIREVREAFKNVDQESGLRSKLERLRELEATVGPERDAGKFKKISNTN